MFIQRIRNIILIYQYRDIEVGAYLSKESLPGAPSIQEAFPQQSHELLPLQTPPAHLRRTFAIGAVLPICL